MHLCKCVFKKERLAALCKFSNLGDGEFLEHAVAFSDIFDAVDVHHFGGCSTLESVHQAFACSGFSEHFQSFRVEHQIRIAPLVHALGKFLLRWIEAVELIEPHIVRTHPLGFANMPLPG